MKNYAFLFWAYTLVWLGIAGYIAFLAARLRKVASRLERMERSVNRS
jgi:CcmD family protein